MRFFLEKDLEIVCPYYQEGHDQASYPQLLHHQHEQMHRNQQHIHHIHNVPNVSTDQLQNPDQNNKTSHGSDIHRAATKIQAQFRGFRARQQMKVMKVKAKAEQTLPVVDPEDPRVHEAATKIQAMIRGRKARKEIKVLRLQNKHNHGRHHGHGQVHNTKSLKSHKDINRVGRHEPWVMFWPCHKLSQIDVFSL